MDADGFSCSSQPDGHELVEWHGGGQTPPICDEGAACLRRFEELVAICTHKHTRRVTEETVTHYLAVAWGLAAAFRPFTAAGEGGLQGAGAASAVDVCAAEDLFMGLIKHTRTQEVLEAGLGTTTKQILAVVRGAGLEFLYIGMLPGFAASPCPDSVQQHAATVTSPPPSPDIISYRRCSWSRISCQMQSNTSQLVPRSPGCHNSWHG